MLLICVIVHTMSSLFSYIIKQTKVIAELARSNPENLNCENDVQNTRCFTQTKHVNDQQGGNHAQTRDLV